MEYRLSVANEDGVVVGAWIFTPDPRKDLSGVLPTTDQIGLAICRDELERTARHLREARGGPWRTSPTPYLSTFACIRCAMPTHRTKLDHQGVCVECQKTCSVCGTSIVGQIVDLERRCGFCAHRAALAKAFPIHRTIVWVPSGPLAKTVGGDVVVSRCTSCNEPTHPSESNDSGLCVACMRKHGIEPASEHHTPSDDDQLFCDACGAPVTPQECNDQAICRKCQLIGAAHDIPMDDAAAVVIGAAIKAARAQKGA